MNKTILLLLFILVIGCANHSKTEHETEVYLFSFFQNNGEDGLHLAYSYDALKWKALKNNKSFLKPEVSQDKLMRDPCIIKGPDNKFHMVWTVSWTDKGIGYANSSDLIHWSDQQFIPVMKHEPTARNSWAPELFYDEDSGQYIIYWATTIPGRFPETAATAESDYNHRLYYTTTKDFKSFTKTELFYDKGFNVIDGTIQKINGEYKMFVKNETLKPVEEKNIRMVSSKSLLGEYSEASEPITTSWVEGPTAIETEEGWIVYFDQYTRHQMGAVRSKDLVNWTDISDKISFPDGTRHGTIFKVKESVLNKLLLIKE